MTYSEALEARSRLTEIADALSLRIKAELESRLTGPIVPNGQIKLHVPRGLSLSTLRLLAIFSWLLADEARCLLQVELDALKARDPIDSLRIALLSNEGALTILCNSYSCRDFYGNAVRTLERLAEQVRVKVTQPPKAVVPNRRRGYRETHKPLHSSATEEWRIDFLSTEEQNYIEQRRKSLEDLFQTFWGQYSSSA